MDVLFFNTNNNISIDIYLKETALKQYLNFLLCYDKHSKKSIPYNLARRFCTEHYQESCRYTTA